MATILIADRDSAARDATAHQLTGRGHRVVTVSSGQDFLASLPDADVALVDAELPDIEALHLLAQAKAQHPAVPVIVTAQAAWQGWSALAAAMKLGADDPLPKPFDPDELGRAVARALSRARANAASTALP